MKRLLIAVTAALMMSSAQAKEPCAVLGELARTVMDSRQLGVALSKLMDIVKDDSLSKRIVLDAYEQPRYQAEEFKRAAVEDFGNKWEIMCYQARSEKPKGGKSHV
jgi:hypothetical protein